MADLRVKLSARGADFSSHYQWCPTRLAARGGFRPVAFTKTHVNRALHPHQRSSDVLHVTPVPGVPMTSGRTPGSAAHPSQATLQVDMSTAHATVRHTKAARHALSVPLPAAPAATCGSAASGLMSGSVQQPHHDEERRCVCICGTRLERIKSYITACMACDRMGGLSSWRPQVSCLEGCCNQWRHSGALIARPHDAQRPSSSCWRSARDGCAR